MANKKVGTKTSKSTQVGRDVYETSDGEMVSEKSTTFQYKGKWINIPTIHNGYQYDDDTLRMMLKEGIIEPTSVHEDESSASKAARERSDNLKFSKGGTPMRKQMKLFNDGGLKEEGGMVDEESGNAVPVGGTRKGVRDDIPAMVSEGEFVFPEDVVRYIGLDKLMQMRQKAKSGLQNMDDMGQMGNSEEATVPDDAPLSPPVGMAEGGVVQQTAAPRQLTTAPVQTQRRKIGFKELMGKNAVEFKEFRNAAGGKLLIPFIGGKAIYPIPSGYTLYDPSADAGSADTNETQVIAQEVSSAINAATGNDNDSNVSLSLENTGMPKSEFQKAGGWDMDTSGSDGKSLQTWITEATKFTNGTSTVVAGVASLFGMGLPVALMNASQKKRVLKEIDDKIAQAKKTSMPGQVAALQKIKEELSKKASTSILGKVVEGITGAIGDLFGADEEEKKKAATEVVEIENETFNFGDVEGQYSKSPSLSTDLPGELSEPEFTSTANMAGDIAKDGEVFQRDFDILTRTYNEALTEVANGRKPKEELDSLLKFAAEKLGPDGAREIKSNSRPLSSYLSPTGNVGEAPFAPNYGQPKLSTEEQIAKRASITPSSGVPFSASADPRLVEAAGYNVPPTEEQTPSFTPSTPSLDKNGNPHPNAFAARAANAQIDANAAIARAKESLAMDPPKFKTTLPGVDPNYMLESLQSEAEPYVVPPSPVTGLNLTPEAARATATLNTTEAGMGIPYYPTAPNTDATGALNATEAGRGIPYYPTTVQDQTKQVFNLDTPTPSVDTSSLAGISAASGPDAFDPRNLGGAEGYGQTGVAPTTDTKTFKETFAEQRKAGAKEFSYDRDGDGKTEKYTTDLAKPAEAAEAGSNSLYQAAANLFTPGDDKEYVGGKLVDKVTNRVIEKRDSKSTSGSATKDVVATSNVVNKTRTAVVKKDQSRYGNAGEGNVWAVQPGTNAVTKVKDSGSTTTSTGTTSSREKTDVQADINKALKDSGGVWTSELNTLVKERDKTTTTSNTNNDSNDDNDDNGGGGGIFGGYSCYVATALTDAGYWPNIKKIKLIKWCVESKPENKLDTILWRNGYVTFGKKIIAPRVDNKIIQWLSNGFYCATVKKERNTQAILGKLFFYIPSYSIGIWKALRGTLVDIERT